MDDQAIEQRSQRERLAIALGLLGSVWAEYEDGLVEDYWGNLQLAVIAQVDINRIVWRLNKATEEDDE